MKTKIGRNIILLSFIYIFISNILPFAEDILEGYHDIWHVAQEGIIAFLSVVAIYIIWQETRENHRDIDFLKQVLKKANQEKNSYSKQAQVSRKGLLKVFNKQFEEWALSKSEQEVALLLIKGLSFEQISQIRGTKEKTVRQQASTVYQKSNLDGRHHLAAYFLEDLL